VYHPTDILAVTDKLLVVTCGRSTPALFDKQTGRLLYHEADGDFTGGSLAMTAGELVFTQADTLMKEYGADLRRSDESSESEIFELATLVALDGGTGHEVFSLRGGSRGTLSDDGLITLIGRKQLIAVDLKTCAKQCPPKRRSFAHAGPLRREREYSPLVDAGGSRVCAASGGADHHCGRSRHGAVFRCREWQRLWNGESKVRSGTCALCRGA
jgi:hypothetical protein